MSSTTFQNKNVSFLKSMSHEMNLMDYTLIFVMEIFHRTLSDILIHYSTVFPVALQSQHHKTKRFLMLSCGSKREY